MTERVHLQWSSATYCDRGFAYCGPGGFAEVPHHQWSCCSLVRLLNHQPSGFALLLACHPTRGLQARRAMLASGPCWISRASSARILFACHRRTPLAPGISVLTRGRQRGLYHLPGAAQGRNRASQRNEVDRRRRCNRVDGGARRLLPANCQATRQSCSFAVVTEQIS